MSLAKRILTEKPKLAKDLLRKGSFLELVGDKRIIAAFEELKSRSKGNAITSALRLAAKPTLQDVKRSYKASVKGNTKYYSKYFKLRKSRTGKPFIAIVASGGKAVWKSTGTEERYTKGYGSPHTASKKDGYKRTQFQKAFRGSMKATDYFPNAISRNEEQFYSNISSYLVQSIGKIIDKCNA